MHPFLPAVALSVLAFAPACVEAPIDEPVATSVAALMPLPPDCEEWGCTGNTPVMGEGFHELHENGEANNAGYVLDGLWKGTVRYQPNVTGARLIGIAGTQILKGNGLTGAYFRILAEDGQVWRIYIAHVSNHVTYWLHPGTQRVETYRLRVVAPGGAYPAAARELCTTPPANSQVGDGNVWATLDEAILYAGDRYDHVTKQLIASTPAESGDWFNIACAGSALAKLHLNRFTHAGATGLYSTTSDERADLLAMYTGNVCGTGRSFTVPGTPIAWGSANGWRAIDDYGAPSSYESVWSGGRAVCLDTFRLPLPAAQQIGMLSECDGVIPPACNTLTGFPAAWGDHGAILSANP